MNKQDLSTSNFDKSNKKYNKILIIFMKVFVVVLVLTGLFFTVICPQYTNEFTGSLLDKIDRLESIEEPKIILIGNSNVAFGIRSEILEAEFEMPVVNAACHVSLGDDFYERMVLEYVKPGDIVIESPFSFYNGEYEKIEYPLLWITIENHYDMYKFVPPRFYKDMFTSFPIYVRKATDKFIQGNGNEFQESAYSRDAFNYYGDNVYARKDQTTFQFPEDYKPVLPPKNDAGLNRIYKYKKAVEEKGGKFYIAAFPIACSDDYREKYMELLDYVDSEYKDALGDILISNYEDYVYPYSYFYDTEYHLTDEGAAIRTYQLVDDLKKALKNGN